MVGVTTGELTRASDGPWPGVDRPAELLEEIAEWLGGYGNRATRRTYAEGLGLPVTAADIRDWLPPAGESAKTVWVSNSWPAAVTHYVRVLGASPSAEPARHRPPPAARGRFRHLHWFRWCASSGVDPLTATSTHVKAWLDALTTAGSAAATRDRMLATVKALYTHLADTGLAAGNPAALNRRRLGLGAATASTTGTVVLTTAQVKALYAAARTPRRGASALDTARAAAVVALFTLGLRVSELCGLDRGDLHVTRGRRALRVHGKGGKTRIVYLHEAADHALTDYLRERDTDAGTTLTRRTVPGDSPLLVTRTGHRYRRQAVWQLLQRLSADTPLHPHALRHFYVTTAVEAGAQLVHVQADVGHSSIDTTEQVYNNAARDPSRSAVDLVGDVLDLG
ncbi:tyrosine-type recombinase/integrase [Actinophytocola sp.]|uniref:tyrosine-type recombinase/integrase n=1 Tax=Actinophytocola sp. TaxID=1872138 RepID=UPI002D71A591|nr:tyrosine-type recombinase/integrase [Actinophytocola sp.]HYQ67733.1 tyrosine-type recombinase/integrase [Actinophytocola sp.]